MAGRVPGGRRTIRRGGSALRPLPEPEVTAAVTAARNILDGKTNGRNDAVINGPSASMVQASPPGHLGLEAKSEAEAKELLLGALPAHAPLIDDVVSDPERLAALNTPDYLNGKTALNYITDLAHSEKLANIPDPKYIASDLLSLVGNPTGASYGNCYGRTLSAVYLKYHPGEYARIVASLADGAVQLASGMNIQWDSNRFRRPYNAQTTRRGQGGACDFIWGNLLNNIRRQSTSDNHSLLSDSGSAMNGEMANIGTRLTGKPHVNAYYNRDAEAVKQVYEKYGPMLAEYGSHGGSIVGIEGTLYLSLESNGEVRKKSNLGYTAIPLEAALEHGLKVGRVSNYAPETEAALDDSDKA